MVNERTAEIVAAGKCFVNGIRKFISNGIGNYCKRKCAGLLPKRGGRSNDFAVWTFQS